MANHDSLTERQRDLLAVLLHAELVSEAGDNPTYNRELCELRRALGIEPDRGREVIARQEREHAERHGLEIVPERADSERTQPEEDRIQEAELAIHEAVALVEVALDQVQRVHACGNREASSLAFRADIPLQEVVPKLKNALRLLDMPARLEAARAVKYADEQNDGDAETEAADEAAHDKLAAAIRRLDSGLTAIWGTAEAIRNQVMHMRGPEIEGLDGMAYMIHQEADALMEFFETVKKAAQS